jgi:hypothetical protein
MTAEGKPTPQDALNTLREKLAQVAEEYANGSLNSSQYNAIYRYYSEKRVLLEHILHTNPESTTWQAIAAQDDTPFLREQFASKLLYCAVFRRGETSPLLTEGKVPRKVAEDLYKTLQTLWDSGQWRHGTARKSLGDGVWLVLCLGEQAMTVTVFYLPPSNQQYQSVRAAHEDFERANGRLLNRNIAPERLVFPQRALFNGRQ